MSGSPPVQVPADHPPVPRRPAAALIVWGSLAVCILLLVGTVNRGLGLTDEAFYLAWIGAPGQYKASITPFGPPLHLLFAVLGRSLIALRVAGILLLLVSGALLGRALGRYYHAIGLTHLPVRTLAALGGIAGLSYYSLWILTPSYNLLANAGGALILGGALTWAAGSARSDRRSVIAGAALIGFGGCVAFFGKPPLAILAGLCVALFVIRDAFVQGRAVLAPLLVMVVACAVPLVAGIALSVGFPAFFGSIAEGVRVLNFGNSPLNIPIKTYREIIQNPLLVIAVLLLILSLAWSRGEPSDHDRPQLRRAFGWMLAAIGAYSILLLARSVWAGERAWTFVGLPTACLAMTILAVGALRRAPAPAPLRVVLPPIVLLLLPFATALGTANRFVHQTGASLYGFLLAAAVWAWICFDRKAAGRVQAGVAVFATAVLLWSAAKPYSLMNGIFAEDTPMPVPFSGDTVLVSPEQAQYERSLRQVATAARLSPTTPIIDLSAGGPGTALLLNAQAPYYPWIIPETKIPGSIAEQAWLSLALDQQRRAWIIGPIRPEFAQTRLGRMLIARRGCYRRFGGLHKVFWDEVKPLEIWVPQENC